MSGTTYYPLVPIWDCATKLEALRESKGLSQKQFAKEVGICHSACWRIENGGEVKLSTAHKIAKFYGLTIDQIWSNKLSEIA